MFDGLVVHGLVITRVGIRGGIGIREGEGLINFKRGDHQHLILVIARFTYCLTE